MLIDMFVTVLLLGGASPDVTIIQGQISDYNTCQQNIAAVQAEPPKTMDPITSRPVLSAFYKCVPVIPDMMITQLQAAKAGAH